MMELTDEQRRAHFSELGHRAVEARRARKEAVARIVAATRHRLSLPDDLSDIYVLRRAADLVADVRESPDA